MSDYTLNFEAIRRARLEAGRSQGEVARAAKVSQSFLSRLERHKAGYAAPSIENLSRVCAVLGIELADVYTRTAGLAPEAPNHMPRDVTDYVWAVSGLTELLGEAFVTSAHKGRMLSWSDGEDGYFLTLIVLDDGRMIAQIGDHVEAQKTYAALGYCRYHGIEINSYWERDHEQRTTFC